MYYWGTRGGSNDVVAGSTNLGVPGYTCLSLINAIDGYLQDHNPTLVVLKCGTNDMAGGVSAQNAADRFQSIVDTILAYSSDVKVLGVGTKPVRILIYVFHIRDFSSTHSYIGYCVFLL